MKKILLITSIILTLSIIVIVTFNNMDNKENNIISNINKDKQIINSNMITMMYETESGSGEYTETKDTTWPESGYIFNDTLSGCENGGELEYNSQNNTVNLLSNRSDRCYVYFDKYDGVWIDNVSVTNVTGSSVTLDVSAISENGSITTYYYALNDSEEYQESTSNIITINDLNKLTKYKIKIYAVDSTNAKSNIYEISVNTIDISVPIINSVSVSNITDSGATLFVNVTSESEIVEYYYVIDDNNDSFAGVSSNNTYTFNNLNSKYNYNVIVFAEDVNGSYSNKYTVNFTTKSGNLLLSEYIKSLYIEQGNKGLFYHISSLENSARDNSYRFAGKNPNNYVCFGSDASTCPSDNLYRIIGLFNNETKLIKYSYAGTNLLGANGSFRTGNYYYWNNITNNNVWSESNLNTVNLNTNYLRNIGNTWNQKISNHNWYVNGHTSWNSTAKEFLDSESRGRTYDAKIGLMYVSDYGFAADQSWWDRDVYDYENSSSSNWMYTGTNKWTITPQSGSTTSVFNINNYGFASTNGVNSDSTNYNNLVVYPVFYLNSKVEYVSGSGTSSDPIRIE